MCRGIETRGKKRKREEEEGSPSESTRSRVSGTADEIVTWNMEGSGSDAEKKQKIRRLLDDKSVKVIHLQECGNPDSLPDPPPGWKREAREWAATQGGNPRCSLASYYRGNAISTGYVEAERDSHRPAQRVSLTLSGRRLDCWNVHAPSGKTNPYRAPYVEQVVQTASSRGVPFTVAGDLNQEPATTQIGPIFKAKRMSVAAPGLATRPKSKKVFDYFLHSPGVQMGDARVDRPSLDSDHLLVRNKISIAEL